MTDAADDLEALFEEVAAQRTDTVTDSTPASSPQEVPAATANEPVMEDQSDKPMYERLGGIVRMLHDSLRELGYDRSLSNVATQISDAQGRLEHIASLTEQAANKVLNTVDTSMPEQEKLGKEAKSMDNRWAMLFDGKLSVDEFKTLAGDTKKFTAGVVDATDAEKARLLDIMMAQDFQDITGQLIKKIVVITNTVETELAQLLRDNAPPEVKAALAEAAAERAAAGEATEETQADLMHGPSSPSTAMAQDDVDSLLADLGF
jgi:chemotaxis protein CheZ